MGWSMIVSILINALVNVSIVLFTLGKNLYLIILKYFKKFLAIIAHSKAGFEFNEQITKDEDYTTLNVLKFYTTYNY
jgi:hypothetical protein